LELANACNLSDQRLDDGFARRLGRHVQGKHDLLVVFVESARAHFGCAYGVVGP
jgi:hypothetical protein